MLRRNGSPTKADIARHANVSHQTVTRVLTGSNLVRPETRERVLAACRKYGYMPNLIARSLKSGSTKVFGLVVPAVSHTFWARMTDSIERTAIEKGYMVLLAQSHRESRLGCDSLTALLGMRVDGLFWAAGREDDELREELRSGATPVVALNNPLEQGDGTFIGFQDEQGAYAAVSHLVELGHRRIAHICGPDVHQRNSVGWRRAEGFLRAMREHGIDCSEDDVFAGDYRFEGGYVATEALLGSGRPYTAILCSSDYVAAAALSCLWKHGKAVPRDVSVVGFAGDPIGAYCIPPLTTVYQPAEELGVVAVETMLSILENKPVANEQLLKVSLTLRESTAPPTK